MVCPVLWSRERKEFSSLYHQGWSNETRGFEGYPWETVVGPLYALKKILIVWF
jgi:hypothetical protein